MAREAHAERARRKMSVEDKLPAFSLLSLTNLALARNIQQSNSCGGFR